MEKNNPLYKDQGIHIIGSIFTVDRGVCKVLLIQRSNEPYKDYWALRCCSGRRWQVWYCKMSVSYPR